MWWNSSAIYNDRILDTIGADGKTTFISNLNITSIDLPNCVVVRSIQQLRYLSSVSFPMMRSCGNRIFEYCSALQGELNFSNLYYGTFVLPSSTQLIVSNARDLGVFNIQNNVTISCTSKLLQLNCDTIDCTRLSTFTNLRRIYNGGTLRLFSHFINSTIVSTHNLLYQDTCDMLALRTCSTINFAPVDSSVVAIFPELRSCATIYGQSFGNALEYFAAPKLISVMTAYSIRNFSFSDLAYFSMSSNTVLDKLVMSGEFVTRFSIGSYTTLTNSTYTGTFGSIYVRDELVSIYRTIASLSSIHDRFVSIKTLPISFNVDGTTFQTTWGTTWGDWIASPANTSGYTITGNSIVTSDSSQYVFGVTPLSSITENNFSYSLSLI